MSGIDQTADFSSHHIEGFALQAMQRGIRADFKVPLITEIAENLWMGGVRDGVRLPDGLVHEVFNLYGAESYDLPEGTTETIVRLLDSSEIPPVSQLMELASRVKNARKEGPVLVHCQAGLNRSSLIVALSLMMTGETAKESIDLIRRKRHEVCLCNAAFESWLLEWDGQPAEPTPEEVADAAAGLGEVNPLAQILVERERQDRKWGEQNHDPFAWLPILVEEVGEVGKAIFERDGKGYYEEVMQVAAVALAMMQSHLRNLGRDEDALRCRPDGATGSTGGSDLAPLIRFLEVAQSTGSSISIDAVKREVERLAAGEPSYPEVDNG